MRKYVLNRIKKFIVKHIFSSKYHFFSVENEKGKKYDVIIKFACPCDYMGTQGVANGEICSHIVAVCKKIGEQGTVRIKEYLEE